MRRRVARLGLGLLLVAVAAGLAAGLWAWREGYRVYAVRTGSMSPGLPPGDLLLDAPAAGSYHRGQVVTFQVPHDPGTAPVVSHRIYRVKNGRFVTKGDANRSPDVHQISAADIVGEVVGQVPRGGYVLVYLSRLDGLASLLLAAVTVWLAWELFLGEGEQQLA